MQIKVHFYLTLAFTLAATPASATFLGFSYKTNWIIAAGDSRGTDKNGNLTDGHCKVFRLDDAHFAAIMGRVLYKSANAVNAVALIGGEQLSAHQAAEKWAALFKDALEAAAGENKEDLVEGLATDIVAASYWGGSDSDQKLALTEAKITYSKSATGIALQTSIDDVAITSSRETAWRFDGEEERMKPAIKEFFEGMTARAQLAKAQLMSRVQLDSQGRPVEGADNGAQSLKFLLDTTIPWAKTDHIGGKVAVLIAERGKPIRWFAPCEH